MIAEKRKLFFSSNEYLSLPKKKKKKKKRAVGQLPPHYPPQQRLQAAGQGSGYPLWACPPAVADPTQTAFVLGRWIGDNVLCHLEEVEYLQQTGQPGCMIFLDFSKSV